MPNMCGHDCELSKIDNILATLGRLLHAAWDGFADCKWTSRSISCYKNVKTFLSKLICVYLLLIDIFRMDLFDHQKWFRCGSPILTGCPRKLTEIWHGKSSLTYICLIKIDFLLLNLQWVIGGNSPSPCNVVCIEVALCRQGQAWIQRSGPLLRMPYRIPYSQVRRFPRLFSMAEKMVLFPIVELNSFIRSSPLNTGFLIHRCKLHSDILKTLNLSDFHVRVPVINTNFAWISIREYGDWRLAALEVQTGKETGLFLIHWYEIDWAKLANTLKWGFGYARPYTWRTPLGGVIRKNTPSLIIALEILKIQPNLTKKWCLRQKPRNNCEKSTLFGRTN